MDLKIIYKLTIFGINFLYQFLVAGVCKTQNTETLTNEPGSQGNYLFAVFRAFYENFQNAMLTEIKWFCNNSFFSYACYNLKLTFCFNLGLFSLLQLIDIFPFFSD